MSQNARPVVLIADKLAQSTVDALGDGVEIRWVDGPNRSELLAALPEADAVLVRSATTIDAEALAVADNLKIIGRAGVGLDNVDIPAATARGVMVVNAPTSNIHSAAEHAVALTMAAARQIPAAHNTLREHEWKRSSFKGVEIFHKTVGVIGLGHICQLYAQRMKAFDTTVVAYDPYLPAARAAQLGVELVSLDELLSRADIISIHLPKTPETAGLINAEQLAKCKDGVIIVNAARGGLIVEEDLAAALASGKVRSAAVDVYSKEPPTDNPLLDADNIVLTPHLGASTAEAQDRAGVDVAHSVLLALAGEFVPDAVNVSGGPVNDEVSPWLELVRKLGLLAGTLSPKPVTAVQVVVSGELSAEPVDILGLAALRGLFSAVSTEPVTFVNAPQIAEERGVSIEVDTHTEALTHRSVVTVRAVTADGDVTSISGALTGLEKVEKIIGINGRNFDMRAEGHNVVLSYQDRPGALGLFATALGNADVDIISCALSPDAKGTGATALLRLNRALTEDEMETVSSAVGQLVLPRWISRECHD